MAETLPPQTFEESMRVPETEYRSAIAIKYTGRMMDVRVTFALQAQDGHSAEYAAVCPRCNAGSITISVKLRPDRSFAEPPACPMLCLDCEDKLDSILEPGAEKETERGPADRASLNKHISTMNIRPWD